MVSVKERFAVQRAKALALGFAVFFLLSWLAVFYPYDNLVDRFGAPLGGDFPMFYVAGQTVLAGDSQQLYDDEIQERRLHEAFPELADAYSLPYRYPPLVAWLMAPLALLPYPLAFAIFAITMLICWWSAAWLLSRAFAETDPQLASAARWFMMGCPIAWEAIIGGQASPLALFIIAATWALLRGRHTVLAGAVLALAAYKPNVLAFVVFGCLLAKPRMWWGALAVWLMLALLMLAAVGYSGVEEYFEYGSRLALERWHQETPYWKVHGLGNVLAPFLGGHERFVLLVCGCLAAAAIAWMWRRAHDATAAARCMSGLLLVNFFCNPYVPIYDLLTFVAAFAIAAQSITIPQLQIAANDRRWHALLLLFMAGPHISQAIAKSIGWQIFPLALASTFLFLLVAQLRRYRRQLRGCALS